MNREKIKEELKAFSVRMIKLLDEEGKECSDCHQQVMELNKDGICHSCSINKASQKHILPESIRVNSVNQSAVDREKERKDIFG